MDLELTDKVAVVAGASRGIGRGIALALAREGAHLGLCARGADDLEEAAEEIRAAGGQVIALPLDVTEAGAAERLFDAVEERFGGVDIYVGNAAAGSGTEVEHADDEEWHRVLDLNFHSHRHWARRAVPRMRRRGGGAIVFLTSIWGREGGPPGRALYTTSKAALTALAKVMASELAGEEIRVLSVAPGSIRFPGGSWDRRARESPEAIERFVEREIPRGRFGRVEEVADVVTFLVSPRASHVTGISMVVDGGQSHSLI